MKPDLDLYTDYLLSSFGQTNATGLARVLEGSFSHDQVTNFLNWSAHDGKALWQVVKPLVRQIQQEHGVLIVDDSIAHKPHSELNGLVCYHYEHTSGQTVKGINFVSLLYCVGQIRLPLGMQVVEEYWQCEIKSQKQVWKADVSKNELFRAMLKQAYQNAIPFRYVLGDSW